MVMSAKPALLSPWTRAAIHEVLYAYTLDSMGNLVVLCCASKRTQFDNRHQPTTYLDLKHLCCLYLAAVVVYDDYWRLQFYESLWIILTRQNELTYRLIQLYSVAAVHWLCDTSMALCRPPYHIFAQARLSQILLSDSKSCFQSALPTQHLTCKYRPSRNWAQVH